MADLDARVRAILDEEEDNDLVDYGDSPLPSPAKPAPAKPAPAPVVPPARSDAPSSADAARAAMERARADADAEALRIAAENLPDDDDDDEDLWDGDEAADAVVEIPVRVQGIINRLVRRVRRLNSARNDPATRWTTTST